MATSNKGFNHDAFYEAVNLTRETREMSWKDVATATAVGTSTLARMSQGKRPDADSLASLSAWSGLNPANFVASAEKADRPESIALISSYLRSDPKLTAEGASSLEEILKTAYKHFAKSE
ncbi:helix-turn-helix domain-containing protein [Methylotenera sp.]|uniref:helix-turn-helix domain-containing protein n=1 Tax=Methylotenera sp. TaxID=2051956 RepID=UPI002EDA0B6A